MMLKCHQNRTNLSWSSPPFNVVLVDQKQRCVIQNKIGREDEQIHLEIHSIFAQMIGKTMEDFSSSFVGGNLQYKIKR